MGGQLQRAEWRRDGCQPVIGVNSVTTFGDMMDSASGVLSDAFGGDVTYTTLAGSSSTVAFEVVPTEDKSGVQELAQGSGLEADYERGHAVVLASVVANPQHGDNVAYGGKTWVVDTVSVIGGGRFRLHLTRSDPIRFTRPGGVSRLADYRG